MAKVTKANMDLRVAEVTRFLLAGHTRSHIIRILGKDWDVGPRQIDEYIHQASENIKEVTKCTAERTLAVLTTNLWTLYRRNRKENPALARQTLMDIAKLHGLEKMNLTLHLERPLKEESDESLLKALGGA